MQIPALSFTESMIQVSYYSPGPQFSHLYNEGNNFTYCFLGINESIYIMFVEYCLTLNPLNVENPEHEVSHFDASVF